MEDQLISRQVAGDLFQIHENRMNAYKTLLHESGGIELDMKAIIERIIEESIKYRQQLQLKGKPGLTTGGEIYNTWRTMAKPPKEANKKTILSTLADDELVMMNTYSMAISLVTEPDMINLLETQQRELKKLHAHIRQYHDAQ